MTLARVAEPLPSRCAACDGGLRPWRFVPAQEPTLEREYLLARCEACGSASTAGDPEPELYESGVYAQAPPRLGRLVEAVRTGYERQKLAILRRHLGAGARVLDAGAGQGRFVVAARAVGLDAIGFEPSEAGVAMAASRGVELQRASLERAAVDPASVDAASVWHVLEHLEDPRAALDRVAGWVRPGGLVLVGVPNLASVQARIAGARWIHLDVPRHRHHFTAAGLRALLSRAGLAPVSEHHVLLEHNPFGMWQAWLDRATETPSYAYNLIKRNAPVNARDLVPTLAIAALAPAAALAELGAGLLRRGGSVAMLARRR